MAALYFASGALLSPMLMNMQNDGRWALLLIPAACCIVAAAVLETERK
jgi:cell division inhibitor SulA